MLARLGQREWALLAVVLTALLGLLWYYLFIVPTRQEIATVRQEIDRLTIERNRGLQAQRALPELRATIAALQAQRLAFLRALPREEKLAEVLSEVLQDAEASGVVVRSFTRSRASTPVPEVRAVNLALALEAPFPEIYAYLRRLEDLSRFSTLSGLNLSVQSQEANPTLATGLTLTVYVLAQGVEEETGGSTP